MTATGTTPYRSGWVARGQDGAVRCPICQRGHADASAPAPVDTTAAGVGQPAAAPCPCSCTCGRQRRTQFDGYAAAGTHFGVPGMGMPGFQVQVPPVVVGMEGHMTGGYPFPPQTAATQFAPPPAYMPAPQVYAPPPQVYAPPQQYAAQPQVFTTAGDNPYAAGMAVAKAQTMHWGIKLALGGGFGVFLLFGLFMFYEWWNGRLFNSKPANNQPAIIFPGNSGGGGGGLSFNWNSGNAGWQFGNGNAAGQFSNALYPGLPVQYHRGGFGWLAIPDLKLVYVAWDANALQQVQANAYAAENNYQVRLVLKDPGPAPGSGSGPVGGSVDSSALRRVLDQTKADCESLRNLLETKLRARTTSDEWASPAGPKHLMDKIISGVDQATGIAEGRNP